MDTLKKMSSNILAEKEKILILMMIFMLIFNYRKQIINYLIILLKSFTILLRTSLSFKVTDLLIIMRAM